MLVRSTSKLTDELGVLTFGDLLLYCLSSVPFTELSKTQAGSSPFALFNTGTAVHVRSLESRLSQLKLSLSHLRFVFLSHLSPERVSGLPYLRSLAPSLIVIGSRSMKEQLKNSSFAEELYEYDKRIRAGYSFSDLPILSKAHYTEALRIDETVADSDLIEVSDTCSIRALLCPGHTPHSMWFAVQPGNFLVVDEGLGYFRGQNLIAPGSILSPEEAKASIDKISDLEISAFCLPWNGVLTGSLVRRHLNEVVQNQTDIAHQAAEASKHGVPPEEIRQHIFDAFYSTPSKDPFLQESLGRSFAALCTRLGL